MAMGSFNRKRQYKQENPVANAGVLARLLGQQSQNIDGISDAVHAQSENVGRQQVAELMGTDEFKSANPAEQQALVQSTTGGRRLGKSGQQTLDNAFKISGDVQSNKWKEDAATLLNTRQNARQAANNAASMSRSKLTHGEDASGGILTPEEFAGLNQELDSYQNILNTKNADPALKEEAKFESDRIKARLMQGVKKTPSNYMAEDLLGIKKSTKGSKSRNTAPKWGGKIYNQQSGEVRNFINSKYGPEVTEGKDGYYFRGQKLTPAYLKILGA